MNLKKIQILSIVICCAILFYGCRERNLETPETQVYSSVDGMYSLTLPAGMRKGEEIAYTNLSVSSLVGGKGSEEFIVMSQYFNKNMLPIQPGNNFPKIESLEEYTTYMDNVMSLSGDISLIWDDADEFQLDGMQKSFEKSGKAEVAGSTVSVCSIFAESESAYYMVMVMGNLKTIESVKKVLSIQEMNTAVTINISTRDFISALSAVPDKINGVNSLDNVKTLFEYAEVDSRLQKNVTQIRKIAREALEGGWGVTERQSLYDMKSWMMEKGLNMDVLSELEDLGVNEDTGRGQLEQIMDTKGLSEQDKIRVMAVYDAKAAFGEAAVKAWDLSQIPGVFTRAYAAGYCTYEEALDSSLEAARLAQQSYDSWLSYYQSYLYGYSYWVGESLDDPAGSAYQRKAVMETLLEEKNGISSIDWNMNLAQEW